MRLCNNTGVPEEENICFLNASLQALKSVEIFREFFIRRDYNSEDLQFPICDEIGRLFRHQSEDIQTAAYLRKLIGSELGCNIYNDGTQQDAGALLLILLDLINTELTTLSGRGSSLMENLVSRQIIANNFIATDDGSCPLCGSPSEPVEQNITVFTLRATANHGPSKRIADIINENFNSNPPSFRKRCDSCQEAGIDEERKQLAKETRVLSHLSNILIFQVDKFDANMQILNKNIDPEDILERPNGDQYDLVSIINHNGPHLNSGHYITFVKKDGKWWNHNDDKKAKPISKEKLVTESFSI